MNPAVWIALGAAAMGLGTMCIALYAGSVKKKKGS